MIVTSICQTNRLSLKIKYSCCNCWIWRVDHKQTTGRQGCLLSLLMSIPIDLVSPTLNATRGRSGYWIDGKETNTLLRPKKRYYHLLSSRVLNHHVHFCCRKKRNQLQLLPLAIHRRPQRLPKQKQLQLASKQLLRTTTLNPHLVSRKKHQPKQP